MVSNILYALALAGLALAIAEKLYEWFYGPGGGSMNSRS